MFPSLTVTNRVFAIKISQCPPTMFLNIIYLTALSRYGFTHVDISSYCFLMQACTNVAVVTRESACFKQLNKSKFSTDILKMIQVEDCNTCLAFFTVENSQRAKGFYYYTKILHV